MKKKTLFGIKIGAIIGTVISAIIMWAIIIGGGGAVLVVPGLGLVVGGIAGALGLVGAITGTGFSLFFGAMAVSVVMQLMLAPVLGGLGAIVGEIVENLLHHAPHYVPQSEDVATSAPSCNPTSTWLPPNEPFVDVGVDVIVLPPSSRANNCFFA